MGSEEEKMGYAPLENDISSHETVDQQLLVDVRAPQSGSGKWKAGLCESFFSCEWLLTFFIPCLSAAQTASNLGLDHDRTFCLTCFFPHFLFPTVFHHRELIRQRHGINGTGCGDFCAMFWCFSCVLAQQNLQTKK